MRVLEVQGGVRRSVRRGSKHRICVPSIRRPTRSPRARDRPPTNGDETRVSGGPGRAGARTLERVAGAGSPRTAAHACFVSVGRRSISARGDRVGRRMEGTQIRCFEPRRTDRRTPPCTSNTRTRYPRTSGVRGSFLTAIWRSASASKRAVAHGTPFPFSFPPYRIPLFQRLGPAIGPVSKTGQGLSVLRGFESLPLRLTRSSGPVCVRSPAQRLAGKTSQRTIAGPGLGGFVPSSFA